MDSRFRGNDGRGFHWPQRRAPGAGPNLGDDRGRLLRKMRLSDAIFLSGRWRRERPPVLLGTRTATSGRDQPRRLT